MCRIPGQKLVAPAACAHCGADIFGEVRHDEDGFVTCDRCADDSAEYANAYRVVGEQRPSYPPGISRRERLRIKRAWLRQHKFCLTAQGHGRATDGVYCASCAQKNRDDQRRRYNALT